MKLTRGNLAEGTVGSQRRPVATPLSPHLGRPSSLPDWLRADNAPSFMLDLSVEGCFLLVKGISLQKNFILYPLMLLICRKCCIATKH